MANVDGDITLRVNVKPGDVISAANDIKQEFKEIFNSTSGETLSTSFNNAKASAVRLYNEMEKITSEMEVLQAKMSAKGVDPDDKAEYSAQYDALVTKLNGVTNTSTVLRDRLNELNTEFNYTAQAEAPVMTYSDLVRQSFSELAGHIGLANGKFGAFISAVKGVGAVVGGAVSNFKKFGSGVLSAIGNLGKFVKSVKNATTHTKRHNTALQMGFKNFIRYGLGVRSVFALLNKMRRALGEGFENLAQYSPEFNSVMSQFVSALETVKNAFATAFAPILSVVIPILDTLMTALINVITLIGKFLAALTGRATFVQAKRVNKDYAASLNKTAKSADGASKGIDSAKESAEELKKTIAGFDDVEILHGDKPSSSSGSGGSGGGGGGGVGDILPSDMFETVAIDSPIANLANRMRELIANQDWTGLGVFLGEQINLVFAKAKQLISWDNLGERITFIVTAITETFNSLVDTIDWELIGSTIAEGLNTVVNTAYLVVTGINWGNFGKKLVEGFNGLVRDVDWRKFGETISEAIKGAIEFVGQGLATVDWAGVGRAIIEFLGGIDWFGLFSELVSNLARILGSIVGGIYELIKESLNESGGNVVGGILEGILEAIKGIPKWIKENIFDPFIEGFNSAFEIESPSKAMEESGKYIMEGVFEGITKALKNVKKWIKENIFKPFTKKFESVFQNKDLSKFMTKKGNELVSGLREGLGERWESVKKFFNEGVSGISETIKNTDWKTSGSKIIEKLKSGASGSWSTISTFFSTKITETKNKFTTYNWKPGGTSIVNGIKTGAQSVWASTIGTYFDTAITGIKNKFNNADWKTPGTKIPNGIKSGLDSGYDAVVNSAESLASGIKGKFNGGWYSIGYNVCSGISSGIYGGTWKVMDAARDLADDLKSKLSSELKINSPSKVMRDLVGRAIPEGIAVGIEAESGTALKAVKNLSNAIMKQDIPQLQIPSVALGEIIPPEVGKNVDTLNETVKALLDVIKYNQSNAITREDITAVLNDVLPTMLQQYVSFYIGDEQVARHANAGNVRLDYRFNPVGR